MNNTVACALPAAAVTPEGAPGTIAVTVRLFVTVGATAYVASPAWLALMVQIPTPSAVTKLPLTVQTPVVAELKVGERPEVAIALAVVLPPIDNVAEEKLIVPIVWLVLLGVTLLDAVEAGPVPIALAAVTVKV